MRFYLQKVIFYVVAIWAAVTLNFLIPRLMPGNPVDVIISKMSATGAIITPATRKALTVELGGGTGSWWSQYGEYLNNLFHGNLGVSLVNYPEKVTTVIGQALPWTIALIGLATVISFVLGIGLGTAAGWRRGSWLDNLIPVTTMFQAVPYFWLALILVLVLTRTVQLFPFAGGYDVATVTPGFSLQFLGSALYYGFLPALTIVLSSVGGWMLGMRNMMVATLSEDYIVTAEAKGLKPSRIRITYAARNAVLPSLSGFAISLGFVVAGSIVTEQVFSYPGIGQLLWTAVSNNDYSLMQGVFLVISLSVLAANLVVDLLYGLIDPRTRARA
ncbi:ABC transporter permease [Curtobacterium sp. MWU13-2055]|uniref:ABC transporter permease n=1 Tax=Curtobacterium sp. MWU13-2055 TaxID=2931928 RepID=UPI00200C6690|nr:ABC transporter permease [Curtobacterium sp. MWU13-2055]